MFSKNVRDNNTFHSRSSNGKEAIETLGGSHYHLLEIGHIQF